MPEIIPHLYVVPSSAVNVFIVETDSDLTLVDAGLPWMAKSVLQEIERIGHKPQDVKHILITHADLDHVGGLKALVDATGATVYASAASGRYLRIRRNPPHIKMPIALLGNTITFLLQRAVTINYEVVDGEVLEIAGGIRVLSAPGHTADHTAYYWEQEHVLFAGDLFQNRKALELSPLRITYSLDDEMHSARKALALNPAVICVGHGQPFVVEKEPGRIGELLAQLPEA